MRINHGYQPYEIMGAPTDVQGAEALKEISPHQFEWWAVVARPSWPWAGFTGETPALRARPAQDHKKGADTGIDGYINFFDDPDTIRRGGQAKQVIVQVKSGYVGVNHPACRRQGPRSRSERDVLEREKAAIGPDLSGSPPNPCSRKRRRRAATTP